MSWKFDDDCAKCVKKKLDYKLSKFWYGHNESLLYQTFTYIRKKLRVIKQV